MTDVSQSVRRTATLSMSENEDVFVLADESAPTPEAARDALFAQAPEEWGIRLTLAADDPAALPTVKLWYRFDERAEEMWWAFEAIAPGDWEMVR